MEGFVRRPDGRKKPMQMPPGGERARAISFFFLFITAATMSTKLSQGEALDNISTWSTEEVLSVLRKVSQASRRRQQAHDGFVALSSSFIFHAFCAARRHVASNVR